MRTRIISIGNSQGVRIPQALLKQSGLSGEVEVLAENGAIVIRKAKRPREGWSEAFERMGRRGDDTLLDAVAPSLSAWDASEWQWR